MIFEWNATFLYTMVYTVQYNTLQWNENRSADACGDMEGRTKANLLVLQTEFHAHFVCPSALPFLLDGDSDERHTNEPTGRSPSEPPTRKASNIRSCKLTGETTPPPYHLWKEKCQMDGTERKPEPFRQVGVENAIEHTPPPREWIHCPGVKFLFGIRKNNTWNPPPP